MTYPLFIDVEFEPVGEGEAVTPLTPVASVRLGYEGANGLDASEFFDWPGAAEYIRDFTSQFETRLVGWDLRNLVWPAVTANIVAKGLEFPKKLLIPMDSKWNNLPMADLRNIVLQGGFSNADISLEYAYWAITGQTMDSSGLARLQAVRDIYTRYAKYDS